VGRRYFRTWRHVLLFISSIIFLIFSGCVTFKEMNTKHYARENLLHSNELLAKGDFKGALEENRKVLSLFVKEPPGDEALFNMGLIYSHYKNPEKDYKESIKYFTELINNYPQSPLIEQTQIWRDVLNVIEKAKQVDIEIEKKKKEMK
jgi:outer membrane protein assembly factor BamD (BamD/ComL family)